MRDVRLPRLRSASLGSASLASTPDAPGPGGSADAQFIKAAKSFEGVFTMLSQLPDAIVAVSFIDTQQVRLSPPQSSMCRSILL